MDRAQCTRGDERGPEQSPSAQDTVRPRAEQGATHPEYREELERRARAWEREQADENARALRETREFVPPNVAEMSLDALQAAGLPRPLARRVRDRRALWLTRMHADDIASTHHADLHGPFSPQGLDLIETRAVFEAVPRDFVNDPDGKKAAWRMALRERLVHVDWCSRHTRSLHRQRASQQGHDLGTSNTTALWTTRATPRHQPKSLPSARACDGEGGCAAACCASAKR